MDSEVSDDSLNRIFVQIPVSSMDLESVVCDVKAHISCVLLGHRGIDHFVLFCALSIVDDRGRLPDYKSGSSKVGGHVCKFELDVLE